MERRPLTVLFCDMVGSVALANALDPEDMLQVLDAFRTACDDLITRHRGFVAKFLGDGVLAYFGYPNADEEDAAHAVRAALALRSAMESLPLPDGITCQARIGVATGFVVINDLITRGKVHEIGVVGEAPNLAARLQSAAPVGGILVAETTRRITAGQFTYRAIEPLTLKGFDAPVPAFEPLEATATDSRSRARAESAGSPLFGRDAELQFLVDLWSRVRSGQGQVALIRGEAGIGKSRLVEAMRRHVADYPHEHSTWSCAPNNADSALYPVVEQVARAAGFERGESGESRHAKLGRLMARYGVSDPRSQAVIGDLLGLPPSPSHPIGDLTPEKLKAVTLDTLIALLESWTGETPALLVFEDLHWSDSTTLEFVDRLVAKASSRRWMVLITARPEFANRWPEAANLMELSRLDFGAAERICAYLDEADALPPEALRQIVARCDGIPLFVEEMTKSVLEGMATTARAGSSRIVIPATLHDLLVARLDRLGPARRVANVGATIGRRFSYELLAEVLNELGAELSRNLAALAASGLVEKQGEAPNSEYMFKHALIRDAAYESVLKRERETLHGKIANALRERFPEMRDSQPELLAYHFTQSGAVPEAIPLWAAAGQRAASRAAHIEAVGHLETALTLLRRQPQGPERVGVELQLLLGLAVSLSASRGYSVPEVGRALGEARAICDALGNVPELFAVLRNACSFHIVAVQMAAAEEAARLCLEMASKTGDPVHMIESQYAYGYVCYMRGDLLNAQRYLELAGSLYRERNGAQLVFPSPQDPLVGSLCALMLVLEELGDKRGADRVEHEIESHVQTLGRAYDYAYSLCFRASQACERRNFGRVKAIAEDLIAVCNERKYPLYGAFGTFYRGVAIGHLEDPDAGFLMASSGFSDLDRIGCKLTQPQARRYLALMRLAMGDAPGALAVVNAGIEQAVTSGEIFALPALQRLRSELTGGGRPGDPTRGEASQATASATLDVHEPH